MISNRFIRTSAFGCLFGHILKVLIYWILYLFIIPEKDGKGYFSHRVISPLSIIIGVPVALLFGFGIGKIIKLIHIKTRRELGSHTRALIGAGTSLTVWLLLVAVHKIGFSLSELFSWSIGTFFYDDFGVIAGIISGLFSKSRFDSGRQPERLSISE